MMLCDAIYEYENLLLGKKKTFSTTYFELSPEQNEKTALSIFRHAISCYLMWSQKQVEECLDWEVIKRMKLAPLMKYIQFPVENDRERDLFVLYDKLYPSRRKSNIKEPTISVYERILSKERSKFPKGYFDGTEGWYRSLICFQHMMTKMKPFDSVDSMYEYFASSKGSLTLKEYKLNVVCNSMYETPVRYLHEALPAEYRNEYLLKRYQFNTAYKKFLAEHK